MYDDRYKKIAIILVTIFALIIFSLHHEPFATKRDKADAIVDWAKSNNNPKYTNYKRALGGNIVEYDNVIKLVRNRNLTVDNVMRNI